MILLTSLVSPAFGQDFSADELAALTLIREADRGLERVYLDQYRYYYAPPTEPEPPEFEQIGAFTWRYDGQYVYSDEVEESDPLTTWVEPEFVLTGLSFDPDAYFGTGVARRTDRYGRAWILDSVDYAVAEARVAQYDADVLAQFGVAEPWVEPNPGIETNPEGGTVHTGALHSWTSISCSSETHFTDHSSDSFLQSSGLNERTRKVVFIIHETSGDDDICTGTMVDGDTVLTAAHCLTSPSGTQFGETSFTVCSMENLDENTTASDEAWCFEVDDVDVAPAWNGENNSGVEDDYGLLHLIGSPGTGWFALSSASDSYINNFTDFHRGFPARTRSCGDNIVTSDLLTTDDTNDGHHIYEADGDIQGTPSGWVKYDTSSAQGASGGPHYYCPNGSCDNGHYLTGVHSGADTSCSNEPCATGYTYGVKARDIRTWVANNL